MCLVLPHLSASSRMMIFWRPGGSVTFCCANILILLRTCRDDGRGAHVSEAGTHVSSANVP